MSVPFTRISDAGVHDIVFYDPAAERRAAQLKKNWDDYFKVGSQEILYQLEWTWWPKYCDTVFGASYYTNLPDGRLVSSFEPQRLIKNDQTLIRLDTFMAIKIFYESIVSDTANVNEVDKTNFDHSARRYSEEWKKALQLMNFYDLSGLSPDGPVTKLEENWTADPDYFAGDRRYF